MRMPASVNTALLDLNRYIRKCPLHSVSDCSPLRNGCPGTIRIQNQLDEVWDYITDLEIQLNKAEEKV